MFHCRPPDELSFIYQRLIVFNRDHSQLNGFHLSPLNMLGNFSLIECMLPYAWQTCSETGTIVSCNNSSLSKNDLVVLCIITEPIPKQVVFRENNSKFFVCWMPLSAPHIRLELLQSIQWDVKMVMPFVNPIHGSNCLHLQPLFILGVDMNLHKLCRGKSCCGDSQQSRSWVVRPSCKSFFKHRDGT